MTARVFLADRQLGFRAGMRLALEQAGFDVVGEAGDAAAAVEAALRLEPDLCILGAPVPERALPVVKQITSRASAVRVLLLVDSPAPEDLVAAVHAGAAGLVARSATAESLVRVVSAVLAGEFAVPRAAVSALVREAVGGGPRRLRVGGRSVLLTEREGEVLDLLARGLTTQALADELGVSPVTVRRHVAGLAAKLGRRGRSELRSSVRVA
jgi:DNA-binding NarL/FixJ family response regulator